MDYSSQYSVGLFSGGSAPEPVRDADPIAKRLNAVEGTPRDRSRFVAEITIYTKEFKDGIAGMESAMRLASILDYPGGGFIAGEGGTGKSFLFETILQHYPVADTTLKRQCSVIYISLPKSPTTIPVQRAMLKQLGQYLPKSKYQEDELEEILVDALVACGTLIILTDEAHHMWPSNAHRRNTSRKAGPLGEWYKGLYKKTGIAQFFGGKEAIAELFDADVQSRTRWPFRLTLAPFEFENNFIGVLRAFDEALPMHETAGLGTEDLAWAMYQSTEGNFRLLRTLLSYAVLFAAEANSRKILREHLQRAHFQMKGPGMNPFATNLAKGATNASA